MKSLLEQDNKLLRIYLFRAVWVYSPVVDRAGVAERHVGLSDTWPGSMGHAEGCADERVAGQFEEGGPAVLSAQIFRPPCRPEARGGGLPGVIHGVQSSDC